MAKQKVFGGKTYTHWSDHNKKSAAQLEASEHDYARVVKEGAGYSVYTRRK